MRINRTVLTAALTATLLLAPATGASATHTGDGCEHHTTTHAHATVPHRNQGTHQAHGSIPYCPPDDAPRHMDSGDGGH